MKNFNRNVSELRHCTKYEFGQNALAQYDC